MNRLLRRLAYFFRRDRLEAELREEMEFHRSIAGDRAFGNATLAREDARAVWIWPSIESVWQDVRYGVRALTRNPGFASVVVVTLASGIGANAAIFSVVRAVILRPMPYANPDRLVLLWTDDVKGGSHEEPTAYLTIEDWRRGSQRFADMALFRGEHAVILGEDAPDRILSESVSANLFDLLGVAPAIGRTFTQEEQDRGDAVVVVSYGMWQRRFGGASNVLEQTLLLDQRTGTTPLRIIGVMPRGFGFPNRDAQCWRPISVRDRERTEDRFRFVGRRYGVVARLLPGATVGDAQAELRAAGQRLASDHPSGDPAFPGFGANVVSLLDYFAGGNLRLALWLLLGAVGVVLLIACMNAAGLLLARGAGRAREIAIRASLGAGRVRLMRQVMTETAVLAIAAGLLGLTLAAAGIRVLRTAAPTGLYPESNFSYALTDSVPVLARSAQPGVARLDELAVDPTVLLFTLAAVAVTTLLSGVLPGWRLSKADPIDSLKRGEAGGNAVRFGLSRGAFVVVECALAVLLLSGAGLLIRSAQRLNAVEPGFQPSGVLLARVSLAPIGQRSSGSSNGFGPRELFYQQVFQRLRTLPGVQSAGLVTDLLVRGRIDGTISVDGRPATAGALNQASVSPGFFETLHVPLRTGRFFSDRDTLARLRVGQLTIEQVARQNAASPVIVNETFVRRFLDGVDPLGKRLIVGRDRFEIVGVAGDMRREGPEEPAIAEVFTPYIGETSEVVVRASADLLALAAAVRQVIQSTDKNAIVLSTTTLEQRLAQLNAARRAQTWLLTAFAGLALLLASIGIYGVVRYEAIQRTHEVGVRMALGAHARDIGRLMMTRGVTPPLIGMATGFLASQWLTPLMSSLLFEVAPGDPATLVSVMAILAGVAVFACWLPARRAMRIDPLVALRHE